MTDCITVVGFTSCQEGALRRSRVCQATSLCSSACSDGQFCSSGGTCVDIVHCNSNFDCEFFDGANVCKQTIHGGARSCQSATSCSQKCSSTQYCDSTNICREVTCSETLDCSTVFGHNSCKELMAGGILTCQQPSTCLSSSYCGLSEYCSSLNTCSSVLYCDTTADCSSFSEPSVCKESVYGGSKTCQSTSTCRFQCSEDQYCDASNICRWTTVFCTSSSDCSSFATTPVCKENVLGGIKTCQAVSSCSQSCSGERFCDANNICQLVVCSVTSDCSTVVGFTSCKELILGGSLTCQVTASCGTSSFCSDGSYCTAANACFALIYCSSNSDCESLPGQPVCKQAVFGGARTCQAANSCIASCSSEQFCNWHNVCQNVYCAIESDCSTIPGFTSCKQLTAGGSRTCQSTSSCGTAPSCSGFCTYTGVCSEICGEPCISSFI